MRRWLRLLRPDALASLGALAGVVMFLGWILAAGAGLAVSAVAMALTIGLLPAVPAEVAMRMMGARPVHPDQAPGLYTLLIDMADAAGLEAPPILYRIRGGTITALSVGDSRRSAIALSDGMTMVMDEREIRGVLAHEVAHIAAADTALMTLAAALGRVVHSIALFGLIFTTIAILFGGVIVPLWMVAAMAGAPWAATLLHLALSRRREFAADETAVLLTGDAVGLARALVKLESLPRRGLARLMGPRPRGFSILRSHPSTRDRIERLVGPIADRVRPLHL